MLKVFVYFLYLCFQFPFPPWFQCIPALILFLTPNVFVSTTAPAYTKLFSSVVFPNSILFIISSTFLETSINLCFSIPLRGGNLSYVSFDSTLRIFFFSRMVMSLFVICIFILLQKRCLFAPQHFSPCNLLAELHILP